MKNITDHAIVRYLQRVKGFDMRKLEKEILSGRVREKIKFVKNGPVKVNGMTLKIANGVIVTVTTNNTKMSKEAR